MWLAVCSRKQCQWDREAVTRAKAETDMGWHSLQTGHRGAVVDIPEPDLQRKVHLMRLKADAISGA